MCLLQVFMDFCWFLFFQCIWRPLIWIPFFWELFFYSYRLNRCCRRTHGRLVWICKQRDVFQFEYWLYLNVCLMTKKKLHSIVFVKFGNDGGNEYVTFITVSLTIKKNTNASECSERERKKRCTHMILQKAQSIEFVCISKCISWDLACIINNWECNCLRIVLKPSNIH